MGAWGWELFQSDHDLDCVCDLDVKADLEQVKKKILANKAKYALPGFGEDDDEPWVTLHNSQYPALVREHLNSGVLERLITDLRGWDGAKGEIRWYEMDSDGYNLCILAACAMQLGCNVPAWFLEELKMSYRQMNLPPYAKPQFKRALAMFRSGVPYDFQSKGLNDTVATGKPEHDDDEINYQALEDVPAGEEITQENTKLKPMGFDFNNPVDSCGNCGSRQSFPSGGKLMRCAGCKKRLYCSENCKKWHWGAHYRQCDGKASLNNEDSEGSGGKEDVEEKVTQEQ